MVALRYGCSVDGSEILLAAILVWLAIGLTASVVMGRRGHDPFGWLVIGTVLGPVAIPIAVRTIREEHPTPGREIQAGSPGAGSVDLLVGLDGSEASERALQRSLELLGDRVGRLTLATVLGHEGPATGWLDETHAVSAIERIAAALPGNEPGLVVLRGRPADALVTYAEEHGAELLVVGRRGHGATKAFLGSTAHRLAQRGGVSVLIV
jgi:nucleotide-binding universal stress UspA family protein